MITLEKNNQDEEDDENNLRRIDNLNTFKDVIRESQYLIGQLKLLRGEAEEGLKVSEKIRKIYQLFDFVKKMAELIALKNGKTKESFKKEKTKSKLFYFIF